MVIWSQGSHWTKDKYLLKESVEFTASSWNKGPLLVHFINTDYWNIDISKCERTCSALRRRKQSFFWLWEEVTLAQIKTGTLSDAVCFNSVEIIDVRQLQISQEAPIWTVFFWYFHILKVKLVQKEKSPYWDRENLTELAETELQQTYWWWPLGTSGV